MKQIISPKLFSTLLFFLSIMVVVKLIWLGVSLLFLPSSGEELNQESRAKALYYRVKLSNNAEKIQANPVKATVVKKVASMRGIQLIALFNSADTLVVTVSKKGKTSVLTKGESIDGFMLDSAEGNSAIFKKQGESFTLSLGNIQSNKSVASSPTKNTKKSSSSGAKIVEQDGIKIIDRTLLTNYISNPKKIWKDISLSENRQGEKLNGFKVNYVKGSSDFQKLGLKRGDILMAINAEKLDNIGAVMSFYKDINNIENLTLTIQRDGKSEDIEYEIK